MEINKESTGSPDDKLSSHGLANPKQSASTDSAVELAVNESSTLEPTIDKVATLSTTSHETSDVLWAQGSAKYGPAGSESTAEEPVIPIGVINDHSPQQSSTYVAAEGEQVTNDALIIHIDGNETDSAYGGDPESETTTLKSNITAYRMENGRRYHAYKDGSYWAPNDDLQNEQLDIAHHLHTLILDGALHLAPIGENPQRVLDLGTGTGIWAIDFADQYQSASVIGTDLSPIQPTWVPPNVKFEIEDFTDEWTFKPNEFDYIHVRSLYGSVDDWPRFYEQLYKHLKPGCWMEQFEISVVLHSDDGSLTPDSALARFGPLFHEASEKFGKTLNIAAKMKKYIDDTGFVNTVEKIWKAPIRGWAADPKLKELGHWGLLELEVGLEGFAMALLTRALGWEYTEVQAFLGQVRTELHSKNIHSYHYVHVVYGQKPED